MHAERRSLYALLVVTIVGAGIVGFGFVDASILESETTIDSSVGTSQVNNARASLDGPVTLYVAGDGWLEAGMADRIADDLAQRGATVTRVESLEKDSEGPILAILVTESSISYSPLSPSSTVETSFAYVHSGNATLASAIVDDAPIVIDNRDAYVVDGDVTVADRSSGLATWPAYQRRVATANARAVTDALASAPGMDQPN
ncbi:Uncharacterized protein HSRCO_2538 [Halanaeroarchaeum sp. HSR-CO]|uniref:hypothetical protein n=1 Tax=Halanaeroarchaeum sp. HSR-CO TaxID=2866382 RepID=UPI00217DD7CF|nr:hypothetical protein [Halanaeroarchaeum sp. HSR-CO]UWG48802.1 Uncharacterized protein HSRCO_2538 [Halanaeroarchaeum sp. HSR-CO]